MNNSKKSATVGQSARDSSSAPFDPWILWVTFRHCWAWALPIGAVLAGLTAFLILSFFVPTYRATHLLEANQDYVLTKGLNPVLRNLAKTETQLIKNWIVLDPVLTDPDCRTAPSLSNPETAELNLRKNLRISGGGNEFRLEISYEDTDPESAALVSNAIAASYLAKRDAFDNQRIWNLEKWLEPEIKSWEREVKMHQDKVEKLTKQTMGFSPANQTSRLENESKLTIATDLRSQLAEVELEILLLEAELAMDTESGGEPGALSNPVPQSPTIAPEIPVLRKQPTEFEILNLVQSDSEVIEAKQNIERYERLVMSIEDQDRVGLQRKEYERFKKKAAEWRQYLSNAEEAARVKAEEQLSKIVEENYQRDLERLALGNKQKRFAQNSLNQRKLEELRAKRKVLEQQYQAERIKLERFGGATAELQFANEDLSVATSLLHKLRDRVATVRTERRTEGAVRSVAAATTPRIPVKEAPYIQLILACVAAFLFPFLLGLLPEIRSRRFTDSNMCEKNGLPIIGEIAQLSSKPRSKRGRRVFEESVDMLRASLFLSIDTKNVRSIAVVSGMSGEGKSSVSSQLALSIAKATGETVLLCDADLRCPDQHEIFGLDNGSGLAAVLAGKSRLSDATDKSLGDLIHVLPAGRLSTSPHRLITHNSMQAFVQDALKEYSYIVMDTAPILSAGETLAVAASVDATLMCLMRDVSRLDNATRAMRRLEASGATLAGTVFSGISARQYGYRYGDYHYRVPADVAGDSTSAT